MLSLKLGMILIGIDLYTVQHHFIDLTFIQCYMGVIKFDFLILFSDNYFA